jgi:hypothetical protein
MHLLIAQNQVECPSVTTPDYYDLDQLVSHAPFLSEWDTPGFVYLLHFFDDRVPGFERTIKGHKHAVQARHYLGWSRAPYERLKEHQAGIGNGLVACIEDIQIVRVWFGTRHLEAEIRSFKNNPRMCPVCNPDRWHYSAQQERFQEERWIGKR